MKENDKKPKKQKKPSIQKAILKLLASKKAVDLESINKLPTSPLAPLESTREGKYAVTRSMKNLVSDGLVESFNSEHKQYFRLTIEGRQKLHNIILEAEGGLVSTTWDGYWRMVLLDLPEDRKNEREALRYLLKKAGFVCVKNSVWISMHPFEHLFTNIKRDLGLTTELIILVTDRLDEDTEQSFLKLIQEN
jgi:DNA-binding PadR family transcriptional regulator